MKPVKLPILILFAVVFNSYFLNCDTTNESDLQCCTNTTDQNVVIEFSSSTVRHEYIVQFKNYYQQDTRAKFLKAALDNTEVRLIDFALISMLFIARDTIVYFR